MRIRTDATLYGAQSRSYVERNGNLVGQRRQEGGEETRRHREYLRRICNFGESRHRDDRETDSLRTEIRVLSCVARAIRIYLVSGRSAKTITGYNGGVRVNVETMSNSKGTDRRKIDRRTTHRCETF